jgi:hypothetical protein
VASLGGSIPARSQRGDGFIQAIFSHFVDEPRISLIALRSHKLEDVEFEFCRKRRKSKSRDGFGGLHHPITIMRGSCSSAVRSNNSRKDSVAEHVMILYRVLRRGVFVLRIP